MPGRRRLPVERAVLYAAAIGGLSRDQANQLLDEARLPSPVPTSTWNSITSAYVPVFLADPGRLGEMIYHPRPVGDFEEEDMGEEDEGEFELYRGYVLHRYDGDHKVEVIQLAGVDVWQSRQLLEEELESRLKKLRGSGTGMDYDWEGVIETVRTDRVFRPESREDPPE